MKKVNEEKIENLLKQLTLDEKIGMIHGAGLFRTEGVERLGIPPLIMSDGPMGVRNEFPDDSWIPVGNSDDYVSYLPCNSAVASTWNRELAEKTGEVLGAETRGRGKDVILAPGINIKRTPLCGRNFEYMSEDPYLTGEIAVPLIRGIQKNDVAACVKHFAMNNQEIERLWVEAIVDDRAVHEIYLPAFRKAVEEGESYSLMGAYNRFRGEHCCESKYLLNDILRKEWNYDGMIVSDWGGVHKTKEAAESALDLEMSVTYNFNEYCMADPLKQAIKEGKIEEYLIDEKVRNILRLMERLHMLEPEKRQTGTYNVPEHRAAALETARESIILLKNEKAILPLAEKECNNILIIGDNAARLHSSGGGSAEIKALYEISPLLGIKKLLGGNAKVVYAQGYFADDCEKGEVEVNWQADSLNNGGGTVSERECATLELQKKRRELREAAVELAKKFDKVILIGGLNHQHDLEGHDRPDMKLPYEQDQLINAVLDVNPNTVVVMMAGSPVEMPWISKAKTLVWSWYNGMEGGTALAEVLFGRVNPSGKLPETLPISHMDCSAHCIGEHPGGKTVSYKEGILVGYRYYEKYGIEVNFPFGYGMSYTTFEYEKIMTNILENGDVEIKVTVRNTGERTGKETVQLYIGKPQSEFLRPVRELRGFEKIELQPGEEKTVSFYLNETHFSYYDETLQNFRTEKGTYVVSSGNLKEEVTFK
ncbi:MAG: beta-glucosidase [Lachnospiraceae bacterium]